MSRSPTWRVAGIVTVLAGTMGFLAHGSPSSAPQRGDCAELLNRAEALLEQHQPPAAHAVINQVMEECPESAQAYNLLGVSEDQQGRFRAAEAAFEKAARLAPGWATVHVNLANSYLGAGDNAMAIDQLKQALKLDPRNQLAALNLANVYLQQKNYSQSRRYFLAAGAAAATDPAERLGLTRADFGSGDRVDGLLMARRLSKVSKGDPRVEFSLGLLLAENGYFQEAVKRFHAIPPKERDFAAYQNLGLSLMALRRFADAGAAFEMALRLSPNNPDACLSLGETLLDSGQANRAIFWLSEAHTRAPRRVDINFALAEALIQTRRYERASVTLQQARQIAPEDSDLLQASGDLAAAEHDDAQAIGWYQRSLKRQPRNVRSLLGLARIDRRLGKTAEARRLYQRVLVLSPGNPAAHAALGQQALTRGRLRQAEAYFTDALREEADLPKANEGMAEIDLRRGRYREAEAGLQQVLRTHPNEQRAHYLLGEVFLKLGRKSQAQTEFKLSQKPRAPSAAE